MQVKRYIRIIAVIYCIFFVAVEASAFSFEGARQWNTQMGSVSIANGDFNGDGILDLAVCNYDLRSISILMGKGDGTFNEAANYPMGGYCSSIVTADFNEDSKSDLAVTSSDSDTVLILLGDGNGTFDIATANKVGSGPLGLVIADFNKDGKKDLAAANFGSNTISILLGNSDGTFNAATSFLVLGNAPASISIADLNGDGNVDLAVANYGSGNVSILTGNGDGTFKSSVNYGAGREPFSVAAGDLNGDGKADLAVANSSDLDSNVSILLGNGNGTFKAAGNIIAGVGPDTVVIRDLDGDGKADILTVNYYTGNISVLLGIGNGTFKSPVHYATGNSLYFASFGDFNQDGHIDLAVANKDSGKVSILMGYGDGTFRAARTFEVGPNPCSIAAGDFSGDGRMDLAVANFAGARQSGVSILIGKGDGSFRSAVDYPVGPGPSSVAIEDFDKDGKPDLAVGNNDGSVSILLGNGDGTFKSAVNYETKLFSRIYMTIADFNNDGATDLVVAHYNLGSISILLGKGDGSFSPAENYSVTSYAYNSLAVGDFNNDGNRDIAVGGIALSILIGNGDGTFQKTLNSLAVSGSIIIADFNGDGNEDIAAASDVHVMFLFGNGNGTFQTPVEHQELRSDNFYAPASDLNNDGTADLILGTGTCSGISINIGKGDGTFETPVNYAMGPTPISGTVADFDGDGYPDIAVANYYGSNVAVMLKNRPLTPITSPNDYILTITKMGIGNGTVTSTPAGIDCVTDCVETYPQEAKLQKVTLKVEPDAFSTFLGWGGDCQGNGTKAKCKLIMDSDKSVSANFGLPDISVSPDSYDFGNIILKQSSSPATFTIQNTGTGNLSITKIKVIGTDAKLFKIKGGSKKTVVPGGNYSLAVSFKPKSLGTKSAIFQVLSNDPDTPTIDIPLSGTGN